ncbi:MAG: glycosyltransferase family 2 protein, partial [Gemmatimonadetes bacterium]|nr:glycosyltransferase family 2 protein [Gemmatimonadota bacterium]
MRLSVCIPTHHGRRDNVREALESVLVQRTGELEHVVEICVSDNASDDGTREMMRGYGDAVRYHRHETNRGFAGNLQQLTQMASGEFCWFLGSDDQHEPGALRRMLALLDEHPRATGVTVHRNNYDQSLRKRVAQDRPTILPEAPERAHVYGSAEEALVNTGIMQTFVSSTAFRRDLWNSVVARIGADTIAREHAYY